MESRFSFEYLSLGSFILQPNFLRDSYASRWDEEEIRSFDEREPVRMAGVWGVRGDRRGVARVN